MISRCNVITFSSVNYQSEAALMAAVLQQFTILVKAGYTCVVKDVSGRGTIIAIEYSSTDPDFGDTQPYWLYQDEVEYLSVYQEKIQYELAKEITKMLSYTEQEELFDTKNIKVPKKKKNDKDGNGGFDA